MRLNATQSQRRSLQHSRMSRQSMCTRTCLFSTYSKPCLACMRIGLYHHCTGPSLPSKEALSISRHRQCMPQCNLFCQQFDLRFHKDNQLTIMRLHRGSNLKVNHLLDPLQRLHRRYRKSRHAHVRDYGDGWYAHVSVVGLVFSGMAGCRVGSSASLHRHERAIQRLSPLPLRRSKKPWQS